jgi:hypothetical protein
MIALPEVGRRAALEFNLITKKGWQKPVTRKLKQTQPELASFVNTAVVGDLAVLAALRSCRQLRSSIPPYGPSRRRKPPLRMTTGEFGHTAAQDDNGGVWSRYDPAPLRMTKQSWPSTDFCGIPSHRRW